MKFKFKLPHFKVPQRFEKHWNVTKNTLKLYRKHDTSTQGAALAYYTVFSIAPLLLIIISVAGIVFGQEAIQGEVKNQAESLVGPKSAEMIQEVVKSAYKPGKSTLFTIIAIIILLLGAIGVFDQLRTALNTIWDIKPAAKKPIVKVLVSKLFSFAMIGCLVFLLIVTLAVQTVLQSLTHYLDKLLPDISVILLKILEVVISVGITTLLFAFIYKFMSDAKLKWHSVWRGAFFTTILFGIGKYLLTLYIGKSHVGVAYGAAGSLIVIFVWVYYSSQILFIGAEFTRALAIEKGVLLDPNAIKPDDEVGIKGKKVVKSPDMKPIPKKKPFRKVASKK